jgi:hypothetical protein
MTADHTTQQRLFHEAIERFDLPAMKKAAKGIDHSGSSSEYYEAWVQAWKQRQASIPELLAGLEAIKEHAGRPAINNETLCMHLLLTEDPSCRQWAKGNHLSLSRSNYFHWLDACIASIDILDPQKETGWIVHSNKSEDFHGALIALAIFGGHSNETLDFLSAQCDRPSGDQIAKGLCSVMYRHLSNDVKIPLSPTHEALAWAGKRCKPNMFKRGADDLLMDEENYDYLVKPLMAAIKAAPAHLAAAALDEDTMQASSPTRSMRL